ncbi:DMT family transporter [Chelatococcus reniformis]|uniref:Membrane protein n=1 Tax=Chelatococcus reniformis TaxID=1494448 RepID=A0A916UAW3_9HYPH|nr:DMT family transporter [Chelatococcus reniformis]GGC66965.1 membrane protein [Chelatococcus reniformis]
MSSRDFLLFVAICVAWAFSTVVSKIVVSDLQVPPLFYATIRFVLVGLICLPWLWPMPKPWWRTIAVALCMGAGSFGLVFKGLETATPSATAIVTQLGVPMTTILSVLVLGERIGWRRRFGIVLAFLGTILVMWDPQGVSASVGLIYVAASALAASIGAIMMKQMHGVRPLQFQAWVGVASLVPMALTSALLEQGQVERAIAGGWLFVFAVLFAAIVVSVFAHTAYYGLIHRYEANLVAPLTLMTPLITIALGIVITGDRLDLRTVTGTGIALLGVLIIAVRRNRMLPLTHLLRERQ